MSVKYNISVSDVVLQDKEELNHAVIWRTMHPVAVPLSGLRQYIEAGHPFMCCKPKKKWDGQQLFCIDIDHFELARGQYTFDEFIAILDALGLPPCLAYTTFSNPDGRRKRFRLLFQLSLPATDLDKARKVSHLLYDILNELVPGAPDKACVSPYHLFYPGKKMILYRPRMSARADIISETIQELKEPRLIIKTTWAWYKMKQILEKDPYIPSVTWGTPPPGYLIILGSEPWIVKYQEDLKTSLGISKLGLLKANRISYNLTLQKKIIDKYYNIQGAVEQSKQISGSRSMTIFEHYQGLLDDLLSKCSRRYNHYSTVSKELLQRYKNTVYQAMGIEVKQNVSMVLPARYIRYAKAVLDLSSYPNLFHLFQRDQRKQQALASILLVARDIAAEQKPSGTMPQYIITHQMIADKFRKKFRQQVSDDGLTKWIRQFNDLQLIHVCTQQEVCRKIRQTYPNHIKRPTILQIPYFDESVLAHAEILAANYKPLIRTVPADNENYAATRNILTSLLNTHGWFSRDAFIKCVRAENEAGNADGYTEENAATYFDKYIRQIQQELGLTKSSCTKELMARFPGNHKIGLTKLYYRGEE